MDANSDTTLYYDGLSYHAGSTPIPRHANLHALQDAMQPSQVCNSQQGDTKQAANQGPMQPVYRSDDQICDQYMADSLIQQTKTEQPQEANVYANQVNRLVSGPMIYQNYDEGENSSEAGYQIQPYYSQIQYIPQQFLPLQTNQQQQQQLQLYDSNRCIDQNYLLNQQQYISNLMHQPHQSHQFQPQHQQNQNHQRQLRQQHPMLASSRRQLQPLSHQQSHQQPHQQQQPQQQATQDSFCQVADYQLHQRIAAATYDCNSFSNLLNGQSQNYYEHQMKTQTTIEHQHEQQATPIVHLHSSVPQDTLSSQFVSSNVSPYQSTTSTGHICNDSIALLESEGGHTFAPQAMDHPDLISHRSNLEICQHQLSQIPKSDRTSSLMYRGSMDTDNISDTSSHHTLNPHLSSTSASYSDNELQQHQTTPELDTTNPIVQELSNQDASNSRQRSDLVDIKAYGLVSQDWLDTICGHLIEHMNRFGICVIDNFLGSAKGDMILKEVQQLYDTGQHSRGRLVSNKLLTSRSSVQTEDASCAIRNDRVIWIDGCEEGCSEINSLIQTLSSVITHSSRLSLYSNNGLDKVVINKRTKAHVACYPGNGTRYIKHVDNPNGDGRVITSIYYLNKDWFSKRDGGLLRMFPAAMNEVANIEPLFDRVLFFWSDRRNPHEVLPAYKDRFAITVWYIGESRSISQA